MRRPVRFSALTIAVTYIVASLIVLTLFAAPILYAWNAIVQERSTERLREDTRRLSNVFKIYGADALRIMIDAMTEAQPEGDEKFVVLADPTLHVIKGNLPAWPSNLPAVPGTYNLTFPLRGIMIDATMVRASLPNGDQLLVGRNSAKFQTARTLFWVGLIGAAGTVLLFGFSGGMLIRAALLAEVRGISKTAEAIVAGDLSRRLPSHGEANELDMLAHTVNRMLDQIEHLIRGVRNVSNAIAHDLRTPLTELRARLEELSWALPRDGSVFAAIESAVADIDRIIAIFNALLRLAEIDNGLRRSGFISTDLSKLVEDAVDFYQPLAEVKGLTLTFAGSRERLDAADPLLLAQAIGNLIDNALKFANSAVRVTLLRNQALNCLTVSVIDDGPGISEQEKDKVIERFYRGDASRGASGVGLGLSLVAAVAKLHGGTLELQDANPGLQANLHI